jgi:hypothetical protein
MSTKDEAMTVSPNGQQTEVKRLLPIHIATLEHTSSHVFSIWFWRKKCKDGSMYHSRTINISWMLKIWRHNKVAPQWGYRTNGAKRSAGDTCLDATFSLGYLILNYVDWDLQGNIA